MSPAHAAYESTPQFSSYLAAKRLWEDAHAAYVADNSNHSLQRLLDAERFKVARLEVCRQTLEHKAAFGW